MSTNSIRLEKMKPEFVENTFYWLQDTELVRQIDSTVPADMENHIKYWRLREKDETREDYAIVAANGQHIGNCGLASIDMKRRKAELWIYIAENRGKGSGSSAIRNLLARVFSELQLNRIYLRVLQNNSSAIEFYRRFGFTHEGCWRADTLQNGQYIDSHWYSMLKEEYENLYIRRECAK